MDGTRSALIIATDQYTDPGLRRLRAPASDARALAAVLRDPGIGGFEVRTLLNEPAHVVNLAVEEFFADRRPGDLLLVHFSGHGVKNEDGELYFAASNTVLGRLGATAVAAEFVSRRMSRSRSRRVVLLLDCCYAGAFERGLVARAGVEMGIEQQFGGRGRAVITASSAMEYAFEAGELADAREVPPSVFTSALVRGLETGEADRDQDGLVGLDELYDYVYDQVRAATPNQTPGKWAFGVEGGLYIARRNRPVTTPAPLPPELRHAIDSPLAGVRAGAVQELAGVLRGSHAGMALAARLALEQLTEDDSRAVAAAAAATLGALVPPSPEPADTARRVADTTRPLSRMAEIGTCPIGRYCDVALSPDAHLLAAIIGETVQVWEPVTGQHLRTLQSHSAAVAFSPDGRLLATGGHGSVQLWDPSTGEHVRALNGHTSIILTVAFSPDGRLLAASDDTRAHDEPIQPPGRRTDTAAWPEGHRLGHREPPPWLRCDHERPPFPVELWDPWTGAHQRTLEGHTGEVRAAAFSPDGSLLATGNDMTVQLWDPATGQHLRTLQGPTGKVRAAAFSPDGSLLATGNDMTVQLWDPATGQHLRTLQSHSAAVAFSSDGRLLATDDYLTVQLWDPATGEHLRRLEGLTGSVQVVGFSVDGRLLVATSAADAVQLWSWAQPSR